MLEMEAVADATDPGTLGPNIALETYLGGAPRRAEAVARVTALEHVAFGHLISLSLAPLVFKGLRPLTLFLP
jgi:hypothetical protein